MLLLTTISSALALLSFTFASPTGHSSRDIMFKSSLIEKLNGPPIGWTKDDTIKIDKDVEGVKLRIHLVQQGMDKFHDMAMRVRYFCICWCL
jgi:tripeptidyl-peptidase-1